MAAVSSVWVIARLHGTNAAGSCIDHGRSPKDVERHRIYRCTLKEAVPLVKRYQGGVVSGSIPSAEACLMRLPGSK
jgi:hypothetical protein